VVLFFSSFLLLYLFPFFTFFPWCFLLLWIFYTPWSLYLFLYVLLWYGFDSASMSPYDKACCMCLHTCTQGARPLANTDVTQQYSGVFSLPAKLASVVVGKVGTGETLVPLLDAGVDVVRARYIPVGGQDL
jgi:hypothetical protein